MHVEFCNELFDLHLKDIASDERYTVTKILNNVALIKVQAGIYQPVFKITADNFDLEPPLVEFADPATGEKLNDAFWPLGPGIANGNSLFPGYFICRPGNKAYHTHPGHLNMPFDNFRNTFRIKRIIDNMAYKIEKGILNMNNCREKYLCEK